MLFALICKDRPGALQVRLDTRPAHLAWLQGLNEAKKVAFAADDRAEAEALAASDPYAEAGVFESVEVRCWNWVVNKPAG